MPMSVFYYICDAVAVWIIVQAVTGKVIYRRGTGYRRDNPRAFWAFIGLETLIVVPNICFQFHLNVVAMGLFLILVAILLGFCLYVLWLLLDLALHPRWTWAALRSRDTDGPKE